LSASVDLPFKPKSDIIKDFFGRNNPFQFAASACSVKQKFDIISSFFLNPFQLAVLRTNRAGVGNQGAGGYRSDRRGKRNCYFLRASECTIASTSTTDSTDRFHFPKKVKVKRRWLFTSALQVEVTIVGKVCFILTSYRLAKNSIATSSTIKLSKLTAPTTADHQTLPSLAGSSVSPQSF